MIVFYDNNGVVYGFHSGNDTKISNPNKHNLLVIDDASINIHKRYSIDVKTRKLMDYKPTIQERIQESLRIRNTLLSASDIKLSILWLPDSFPTLTAAQKKAKVDALLAYRQALRDITKQADQSNITWPQEPRI